MRVAEFAVLGARLLLAFVFLLAGATKLVDPVGVRRTWRDFGLPGVFAGIAVILLPLMELAVGVALIPPSLAWYGAYGALALLTLFLIVIGLNMARGRKPDCRCFGQVRSAPVGRSTLIRDGALLVIAGWLVSRGPLHSGPGLWESFAALSSQMQKLSLLAACAVVFLFLRLLDRSRPRVSAPAVEEAEDPEELPVIKKRAVSRPQPRPTPVESPSPAGPSAMGIGLPIGTPAPNFTLPALTGETLSLESLRTLGKDILLVFSSPYCEPCHALAPKLIPWAKELDGVLQIVIVSRGAVKDNRAKLEGLDPARVLLQREFEISETYDCNVTPTAVLVGADGLIRSELAAGGAAILQLLASCAKRAGVQ